LISGSTIDKFEKQFSTYINTKYAISVPSGRLGLYLILKALGIENNDEVIISSYNSPIIPNMLRFMEFKPIFVDIKSDTFNINTKLIERKISKKTRAIIVLHTEGQPCELDEIIKLSRKYNLYVIEDCAHSIGSEYKNRKVGSIGDVGFFSFGIGKFINTLGGGIVVTNNKKIAHRIRKLMILFNKPKEFDLIKKFCFVNIISFFMDPIIFGVFIYPFLIFFSIFNVDIIFRFFEDKGTTKIKPENFIKFSNFQAILGLNQLKEIETHLKKQIDNANFFIKNINQKKVKFQKSISNINSFYLHFTVLHKNRNKMIKQLLQRGIDAQISWMNNCSSKNECPISDSISKQAFYIPIYHTLTKKQVKYIADILNNVR
jgi:dTDP-4-amino-4,6-dideoxygalactose transaminase